MNAGWLFPLGEAYSGDVAATVRAEIRRLKLLFREHCKGPYDKSGAKFGLALFVQGVNEIKPMNRRGLRLEPFRNNSITASIYIHRADWDIPSAAFRSFLWQNAEEGVKACVSRLKDAQLKVDEERLRNNLDQVRSQFLGISQPAPDQVPNSIGAPQPKTDDEEDRQVIIQYQIEGSGTAADLDRRHSVEQLLASFLEENELGYCDGGDIGSGSMNVFCFVKPRPNAVEGILETLRRNCYLDDATVAVGSDGEEKVIWPSGHSGSFELAPR